MGIENWGGTEMIQWISTVVSIPVHEVKVLRDMDPCPCVTMYISFDNEEQTSYGAFWSAPSRPFGRNAHCPTVMKFVND